MADMDIPKQIKNKGKINKGILDFYFEETIKENTIMLESLGKWPKGNIVYIIKELLKKEYAGLTVYFSVTEDTKHMSEEYFKSIGAENIECVIAGKGKYKKLLSSVKYLINEADFPNYWIKKKEQIYINIWHGTPLKKLGLVREDQELHNEGTHQKNFMMADYILCPNRHTARVLTEDYYIENFAQGKIMFLGYPRTGELLNISNASSIREILGKSKKNIFAYMPTWREGEKQVKQINDMLSFFNEIDGKLTDEQIMYVNLHHKINREIDFSKYSKIKEFPKGMEVYQVLKGVDTLITDYSSIMFDFAVTHKNIVIYANDIDAYVNSRGMYFDIHKLPFPITTNVDDLLIHASKEREYDDVEFLNKYCQYDSNRNSELLCKALIKNEFENILVEDIKSNSKPNVIICTDGFVEKSEAISCLYEALKKEGNNVYISSKNSFVEETMHNAYPFIENIKFIGTKGKQLFTKEQKELLEKYNNRKVSFRKLVKELKTAYETEQYRLYPTNKLSKIYLYYTINFNTVLAFSQFTCEKYLFINKEMIDEGKENSDFKKAIRYFSKHGDGVLVSSEELKEKVKKVFGIRKQKVL